MSLSRRGFLGGLLAAPVIIRTEGLLMPVKPRLVLWGDGIHDDTEALQAIFNGHVNNVVIPPHISASANANQINLQGGMYKLSRTLTFDGAGVRGITISYGWFTSTATEGALFEIENVAPSLLAHNYMEVTNAAEDIKFMDHWSKET